VVCKQEVTAVGTARRPTGDPAMSPCPLRGRRANADTPDNGQGFGYSAITPEGLSPSVRRPSAGNTFTDVLGRGAT